MYLVCEASSDLRSKCGHLGTNHCYYLEERGRERKREDGGQSFGTSESRKVRRCRVRLWMMDRGSCQDEHVGQLGAIESGGKIQNSV